MRVKWVEARNASHTETPKASVVINASAAMVAAAAAKLRHRPVAASTSGNRMPNCGL